MQTAKEFFLSALGIDNINYTLLTNNLKLQRKNEREPFGEIVTTEKGTIFRVGAVYENGIKVII